MSMLAPVEVSRRVSRTPPSETERAQLARVLYDAFAKQGRQPPSVLYGLERDAQRGAALTQPDFSGKKTVVDHLLRLISTGRLRDGNEPYTLAAQLIHTMGTGWQTDWGMSYARSQYQIFNKAHPGEFSRIVVDLATDGHTRLASGIEASWDPAQMPLYTGWHASRLFTALAHALTERGDVKRVTFNGQTPPADRDQLELVSSRLMGQPYEAVPGGAALAQIDSIVDSFGPVVGGFGNRAGAVGGTQNRAAPLDLDGRPLGPDLGYLIVPKREDGARWESVPPPPETKAEATARQLTEVGIRPNQELSPDHIERLEQKDLLGQGSTLDHVLRLARSRVIDGDPGYRALGLYFMATRQGMPQRGWGMTYATSFRDVLREKYPAEVARITADLAITGQTTLAGGRVVSWNPRRLQFGSTPLNDVLPVAISHALATPASGEGPLPLGHETPVAAKGQMANIATELTGRQHVNVSGREALPRMGALLADAGPLVAEFGNRAATMAGDSPRSLNGDSIYGEPGYVVVPEDVARKHGLDPIVYSDSPYLKPGEMPVVAPLAPPAPRVEISAANPPPTFEDSLGIPHYTPAWKPASDPAVRQLHDLVLSTLREPREGAAKGSSDPEMIRFAAVDAGWAGPNVKVATEVQEKLSTFSIPEDAKRVLLQGTSLRLNTGEPLVRAFQAIQAAQLLSEAAPPVREKLESLLGSAGSDVERATLLKAMAVRGATLASEKPAVALDELDVFAEAIRGAPTSVLLERSSVLSPLSSQPQAPMRGVRQIHSNGCVAASVVTAWASVDPVLAWVWHREGSPERQQRLLTRIEQQILTSDLSGERGVSWDVPKPRQDGGEILSAIDRAYYRSALTSSELDAVRRLVNPGYWLSSLGLRNGAIESKADQERFEEIVANVDKYFPGASKALAKLEPYGVKISAAELLRMRQANQMYQRPKGVAPESAASLFLSPVTHLDYNRVKYLYRLSADPLHTERLAQIVEAGQIPLLRKGNPEDRPEDYSHAMAILAVSGDPGQRSFLVTDTTPGEARWMSQAEFNSEYAKMSYYFADSSPTPGVGRIASGRPEL